MCYLTILLFHEGNWLELKFNWPLIRKLLQLFSYRYIGGLPASAVEMWVPPWGCMFFFIEWFIDMKNGCNAWAVEALFLDMAQFVTRILNLHHQDPVFLGGGATVIYLIFKKAHSIPWSYSNKLMCDILWHLETRCYLWDFPLHRKEKTAFGIDLLQWNFLN